MKWIKIINKISSVFVIVYYIIHWFLVPRLLPQPPAIAREVGQYLWWTSLNKGTQQTIIYTTYFLQFLIITALLFYIINLFLRFKYHQWNKWFVIHTLLFIPALPFLIMLVI